ncbi:hypothetical protein HLB23_17475 [Nocardia uniformis]|uniref:DUF5655 domain-containing protein n=1 Tax=Nocardia uniformis TaxID=53432 RepID=A0A849BZA0_9NOCA|nr:DUF5655 domain-containing protein [Nocardia uniformis]NNH71634.1 hypothetical protein [Nocardia uniformis]
MGRTVDEFLADKKPGPAELFREFRDRVLILGPLDERVHATEVAWARTRVFATAFIVAARLEVAVDLLRPAAHPRLVDAFPTTKTVVTHRLSFTTADQIDESVDALLVEAYETVGPGTRNRR